MNRTVPDQSPWPIEASGSEAIPVVESCCERSHAHGSQISVVVSEHDPARVELLQPVDPSRRGGARPRRDGRRLRPPGEHVCAVGARRVVALACDHHGAVAEPDDERLMPCGVTRRRHHDHPGQDLGLAFQLEVAQSGRPPPAQGGCSRRPEPVPTPPAGPRLDGRPATGSRRSGQSAGDSSLPRSRSRPRRTPSSVERIRQ